MFDGPAGADGGGECVRLHRVTGCQGFQCAGDAHRMRSGGRLVLLSWVKALTGAICWRAPVAAEIWDPPAQRRITGVLPGLGTKAR